MHWHPSAGLLGGNICVFHGCRKLSFVYVRAGTKAKCSVQSFLQERYQSFVGYIMLLISDHNLISVHPYGLTLLLHVQAIASMYICLEIEYKFISVGCMLLGST